MITVEEALKSIRVHIKPTSKSKKRALQKALGQVLFKDVSSPINMPPFRQSAMDGYAVNIHENKIYNLIGEVKTGDNYHPVLKVGEAVRIFTGAAVPNTANAVVMQEIVTVEDKIINIEKSIESNTNIRPFGEQVKKGEIALTKGTTLTPAGIGYLSSLGIKEVTVYQKPSIAIVVTGSELVKAGKKLEYGKIYESNSAMLKSAVYSLCLKKVSIHKIKDDYTKTHSKLKKIISKNDLVLITGGISVGDYDFVGKALQELSVEQLFYKVKQKPGKPLFFGKKDDTIVFALPGNPASALSCFYIYVQTALKIMSGCKDFSLNRIKVKSNSNFTKKGDRPQFLKAILKNGKAEILEGQSSAMQQTFALANAFVYVPAEKTKILIDDIIEIICLP
jgi:molybdopterin molybdotransferase